MIDQPGPGKGKTGLKAAANWEYSGDLVAALSLANLCLIEVWRSLLSEPRDQYYFSRSRELTDYLAVLLALGCLAIIFFTLLVAARQVRPRVLWQFLLAGFALISLNLMRLGTGVSFGWLKVAFTSPALMVLFLVVVAMAWRKRAMLFVALRTVFLVLSPFLAVTVSRSAIGVLGVLTSADMMPSTGILENGRAQSDRPQGRVIVMLFDELDERFINPTTRPGGLNLPELDRLRRESVVFNNASRPGVDTLTAIPALTTGRAIQTAVPVSRSELRLVDGDGGLWSHQANVFDLATSGGSAVHIVGWYHPYCRVFPRVASCTWQPHFESGGRRSNELRDLLVEDLLTVNPLNRRRVAVKTYEQILRDTLGAVAKRGLIWAHFPIPHPPAIFDPGTQQVTWWGSDGLAGYLSNLFLVDQTVGSIRRAMGPLWDESTIILVSDHNWRQAGLFGGESNARVPLYVKLPGGSGGSTDEATTARILPFVVLAALRGEAKTRDDLERIGNSGASDPLR